MSPNEKAPDTIPSDDQTDNFDNHTAAAIALISPHTPDVADNDRRLELAGIFRKDGNHEMAQALYQAVLETEPLNRKALRQRAACSLDARKLDQALQETEDALVLLPGDPVLQQTKSKILQRRENSQVLTAARQHLRDGNWASAAQILDDHLAAYPDHAAAITLRAFTASKADNLQDVLQFCSRGLALEPFHTGMLSMRAEALTRTGQPELAREQLEAAYCTNSALGEGAIFALAEARCAAGDERAADTLLCEFLAKSAGNPQAHLARIRNALAMGDIDGALDRCEAALKDHPDDIRFLSRKALALSRADVPDKVLELLDNLPDEDRRGPPLQRLMAASLLALGRHDEAQSILQDLLSRDATDREASNMLTELIDCVSGSAAALQHLECAPVHPTTGDSQSVTDQSASAADMAKQQPAALLKYLQLCLRSGRTDQARQIMERLGELGPDWTTPQLIVLTGLAQKTGNMNVVVASLSSALSHDGLSPVMALNVLRMAQASGIDQIAEKVRDALEPRLTQIERATFRLQSDLTIYGPQETLARLRMIPVGRRGPTQAEVIAELLSKAGKRALCLRYLRFCRRRWPNSLALLKQQIAALNRFGAAEIALDVIDQLSESGGGPVKNAQRVSSLISLGRLEDALKHIDKMGTRNRRMIGSQAEMLIRLALGDAIGAAALVDAVVAESGRSDRTMARFRTTHLGAMLNELQLIERARSMDDEMADDHSEDMVASFYFPARQVISRWQSRSQPRRDAGADCAIPRRIVQYWDQEEPPAAIAALMKSWQHVAGYSYQRYNRRTATAFLAERFDMLHVRAFRLANGPSEECDFLRLCLLLADGGIYADADDLLLGDLDELRLKARNVVLYRERFGAIGNNFLATSPGHPLFRRAVDMARESLLARENDLTWSKLGPGLMTRATGVHLMTERDDDLAVISEQELARTVQIHMALPYKTTPAYWNSKDGRIPHEVMKVLTDFCFPAGKQAEAS
ncbi:tetratricopeptide repeat protein [Paracoccus aestuariivivens]|uniref:Tetratricopeptide repeat protein n=1 Tax=Paracoccus aestuariivivens TaxID=1820333 RepID=A0A6L6JHP5_9RHOB|nr:tetratricopeptide repeat protein [Paracoccus aestuariivivens]MTH80229.1 tetratricopeptide repeat protein [Paracoccus aestuariivivens]